MARRDCPCVGCCPSLSSGTPLVERHRGARFGRTNDATPLRVIADLLTVRLRVIVGREGLDHQLAEGADPHTSPALGLRAAQLCKTSSRGVIARRLRRTLRAARVATSSPGGSLPLARDQILAESDTLMDLVRRLEAPGRVEPMGVALARLLVSDPVSPLSVPSEPRTLYMAVRLATAAMGPSVERPAPSPRR